MSDDTHDLTDWKVPKPRVVAGHGHPIHNTVATLEIGPGLDEHSSKLRLVDFSRVHLIETDVFMATRPYATSIGVSTKDGEILMNILWAAGVRPNWWKSDNEAISAHKAHIDSLKDVNRHFMEMEKTRAATK